LEKNITIWLETKEKRDKGHASFRSYHLIMAHLVTVRIIAKKCQKINKSISRVASLTLGKILI